MAHGFPRFTRSWPLCRGPSSPSCPTPWSPRTRWRRTATPCTGAGRRLLGGRGVAGEGSLQRPRFASCQGEVLASRKDFRVNTCTPHPRGTFLLEPLGVSLMEALQPWNPKGEDPGGDEAGSRPLFGPACWAGPLPTAGSAPEGPRPVLGCVPCPQFWPRGAREGPCRGSRADRVRSLLSPRAWKGRGAAHGSLCVRESRPGTQHLPGAR